MAPTKFEEHIKDKLDDRKIKPSANAWDKISTELGNSSAVKKHGYRWYAIAASVIGLLIASIFFFSDQEHTVFRENQVVDEGEKEILKVEKVTPTIILRDVEVKEIDLVETNADNTEKFDKPDLKLSIVNPINKVIDPDTEFAMAEDDKHTKLDDFKKANLIVPEALINAKITALVAQVDSLELNNTTVTDAEIDALLRKAQNEILEQKLFRNDHTVDAMALLAEVEDELDVSFRNQLFETLKNGYLKVRTAVADRNN